MNILGKTVILGLSATCLGTAGNFRTAHASNVKVTQYRALKTNKYTVVSGSKGYLYKDATLKHKLHSVKSYSKVRFIVSKEVIVRHHNGKKAVYYHVKNSKVSGWLWHGYLTRISVKKTATAQNTDLQQKVASLQQQLNDLKNQNSNSSKTVPTTNLVDVTAQISSLRQELNYLKNQFVSPMSPKTISVSTDNHTTPVSNTDVSITTKANNSSDNDNPFNGTPTEYYVQDTGKFYLYPNEKEGYPTILSDGSKQNKFTKTLQIYAHTDATNTYGWSWGKGMLPVKYNGQTGYIYRTSMTLVPVNERFYHLENLPDNAGYGNIAPTEVKISNPLVDGATWTQYTKDAKYFNKVYWTYQAATNTWKKDE